MANVLAASKDSFKVEIGNRGRGKLTKSRTKLVFSFPRLAAVIPKSPAEGKRKATRSSEQPLHATTTDDRTASPAKKGIALIPRSPDAMIYYLGEIVRAQFEGKDEISIWTYKKGTTTGEHVDVALYKVRTGAQTEPIAVETTIDGTTFWIPASCSLTSECDQGSEHRSLQVIAFVNQVFSLQKKATNAPAIPSITVLSN